MDRDNERRIQGLYEHSSLHSESERERLEHKKQAVGMRTPKFKSPVGSREQVMSFGVLMQLGTGETSWARRWSSDYRFGLTSSGPGPLCEEGPNSGRVSAIAYSDKLDTDGEGMKMLKLDASVQYRKGRELP